jgi:hypothetical protein
MTAFNLGICSRRFRFSLIARSRFRHLGKQGVTLLVESVNSIFMHAADAPSEIGRQQLFSHRLDGGSNGVGGAAPAMRSFKHYRAGPSSS